MDEPVVSLESFYALKTGHNPGPPGGGKFLGFVGGSAHLRVVPAGNINIPSGFLEAADPFVDLGIRRPIFVPAGTFPVFVTITDLSEEQDRSYERNAYLSVVFNDGEPATVRPALDYEVGKPVWVSVDAGSVCFCDHRASRWKNTESIVTCGRKEKSQF